MTAFKIMADGISSVTDARYFASKGVDYLCFHDSSDQGLDLYREAMQWVAGVKAAIRLTMPTAREIKDAVERFGPDAVCVGAGTELQALANDYGVLIFKEVDLGGDAGQPVSPEWEAPFVDAFLITKNEAGSRDLSANTFVRSLCQSYDVYIHWGVLGDDPDRAMETVRQLGPAGLILPAMGEEPIVGVKSFETLDRIFDRIIASDA